MPRQQRPIYVIAASMKPGLLRLWLFLSAIWLASWGAYFGAAALMERRMRRGSPSWRSTRVWRWMERIKGVCFGGLFEPCRYWDRHTACGLDTGIWSLVGSGGVQTQRKL